MLLAALGLLFLPPTWRFVAKKIPRLSSRKVHITGAIVILAIAIAVSPTSKTQDQTATIDTQSSSQQESPEEITEDKPQKLLAIETNQDTYYLSGSGKANTGYDIKIPDASDIKIHTDNHGTFKQELPAGIQVFGSFELTRDTNGIWFGGQETYDIEYFILNGTQSLLSEAPPKPTIITVQEDHSITGYYMPRKNLLLKSGDSILASTSVDQFGKFTFESINIDKNYIPIAIYEKVSTGWFSSKEERLSNNGYLDKKERKLIDVLPITTKEVSVTEAISFSSRTIKSQSLAKGQTKVTQEGVNGEQKKTYKVTYSGDEETKRELVKSNVVKKPIDEITMVGTYVYVSPPAKKQTSTAPKQQAPQTTSNGRTGAICRDGSRSYATGRGACSHHGGVAQWLY